MPGPSRVWFVAASLACCTPNDKPEPASAAKPEAPVAPPAPVVDPFEQLLKERGLVYEAPSGYSVVEVPASERWRHVRAIKSDALDVEIRFGAAPAGVDERLRAACGDDARCVAAPSKAALEGILGAAVVGLAAPGSAPRIKEFPLDAVRNEFNAHWGGAIGFDVDPAFAARAKGLAIVIHRVGRAPAMFVTLYPEATDAHEDERMRAFHALRFGEPFVAKEAAHAGLAGTFWECSEEFAYLRFEPTTLTVVVLSAAMLVMGNQVPFETDIAELTYLPDGRLSATSFRVDNMERGDRTPETPVAESYSYVQNGESLTFKGEGFEKPWACTRIRQR